MRRVLGVVLESHVALDVADPKVATTTTLQATELVINELQHFSAALDSGNLDAILLLVNVQRNFPPVAEFQLNVVLNEAGCE